MTFWQENYSFIREVYDTRYAKMVEWMDNVEMAIQKVCASKVYTSAEFKREKDNFHVCDIFFIKFYIKQALLTRMETLDNLFSHLSILNKWNQGKFGLVQTRPDQQTALTAHAQIHRSWFFCKSHLEQHFIQCFHLCVLRRGPLGTDEKGLLNCTNKKAVWFLMLLVYSWVILTCFTPFLLLYHG